LEESINSSEESTIAYLQQLISDYPLVLALIAVILLIVVVLVVLLLTWQAGNRVSQNEIKVELKQIDVASNGILVDVDALIKNVREITVTLSTLFIDHSFYAAIFRGASSLSA